MPKRTHLKDAKVGETVKIHVSMKRGHFLERKGAHSQRIDAVIAGIGSGNENLTLLVKPDDYCAICRGTRIGEMTAIYMLPNCECEFPNDPIEEPAPVKVAPISATGTNLGDLAVGTRVRVYADSSLHLHPEKTTKSYETVIIAKDALGTTHLGWKVGEDHCCCTRAVPPKDVLEGALPFDGYDLFKEIEKDREVYYEVISVPDTTHDLASLKVGDWVHGFGDYDSGSTPVDGVVVSLLGDFNGMNRLPIICLDTGTGRYAAEAFGDTRSLGLTDTATKLGLTGKRFDYLKSFSTVLRGSKSIPKDEPEVEVKPVKIDFDSLEVGDWVRAIARDTGGSFEGIVVETKADSSMFAGPVVWTSDLNSGCNAQYFDHSKAIQASADRLGLKDGHFTYLSSCSEVRKGEKQPIPEPVKVEEPKAEPAKVEAKEEPVEKSVASEGSLTPIAMGIGAFLGAMLSVGSKTPMVRVAVESVEEAVAEAIEEAAAV